MEKANQKRRDTKFFSGKNQTVVCVHTVEARVYTQYLEILGRVERYETNPPLELAQFPHLNTLDIRPEYFSLDWISDFRVYYDDGTAGIREIVREQQLKKRSVIEQLELSRRYWQAVGTHDWKIVTDTALKAWKEVNK